MPLSPDETLMLTDGPMRVPKGEMKRKARAYEGHIPLLFCVTGFGMPYGASAIKLTLFPF